jgi:hypothetical protein
LDTHIAFLKKNLHFLQTLKSNADETAKKTENFFINVSYKLQWARKVYAAAAEK